MKQLLAQGIVLNRTDYGEADRILTLITPNNGKLRVMARGVRKHKSKLAGGIELFSTSDISYIPGRGEIGTLVSTRLITHYGNIVKDINRVQLGYELIRLLNKVTEDSPEPEYFYLLDQSFQALDDVLIETEYIRVWFEAQLLRLTGHTPNLTTDTEDKKLIADQPYNFDFDSMCFTEHSAGQINASHIKSLRLLFSANHPKLIYGVQGVAELVPDLSSLVRTMRNTYINV